jgi:hypothetical protein
MGGGLLQLVAYGAQDVYLTGNPQITFWKVSYRRYTNFSMESIQQSFTGGSSLDNFNQRVSCQIARNGDLIHKIYLEAVLGYKSGNAQANVTPLATFNIPSGNIIKTVEVEIGGQTIDKHYGEWGLIWNSLSLPLGKQVGFVNMTQTVVVHIQNNTNNFNVQIPCEFWFCRNPGLALPLIALQYHEVKINIEFGNPAQLKSTAGTVVMNLQSPSLWVDYIFLDTDERRRMAQNPHEYLIEQLQFTGEQSIAVGQNNLVMNFNHPVKELIWVATPTSIGSPATGANTTTVSSALDLPADASGIISIQPVSANIKLNGQDRFETRTGDYFTFIQPYQHHTNSTNIVTVGDLNVTYLPCVYSFALRPEEHQPSGTCNFSRIDSAILSINYATAGFIRIYATNYNVLRIMSGMGGLAYSN